MKKYPEPVKNGPASQYCLYEITFLLNFYFINQIGSKKAHIRAIFSRYWHRTMYFFTFASPSLVSFGAENGASAQHCIWDLIWLQRQRHDQANSARFTSIRDRAHCTVSLFSGAQSAKWPDNLKNGEKGGQPDEKVNRRWTEQYQPSQEQREPKTPVDIGHGTRCHRITIRKKMINWLCVPGAKIPANYTKRQSD